MQSPEEYGDFFSIPGSTWSRRTNFMVSAFLFIASIYLFCSATWDYLKSMS